MEGKVRVQLNLKVEHTPSVKAVEHFRDFVFPIMWLEEVSCALSFRKRKNVAHDTVFVRDPRDLKIMSDLNAVLTSN